MSFNNMQILLVEDDVVDQMAFKRMISLEEPSYRYSIANSTKEAKILLSNSKFDIAVIDYNLGDGTAFDIVKHISDTPVIIVTGEGDEEMAVRALKAGAFHYLVKDNQRNYLKVMPSTMLKAIRHFRIERERKQALYDLRKSEIKHRILLSNLPSPVLGLKEDLTIFYCNRAYAELFSKQVEDLEGKEITKLFPNIKDTKYYHVFKKALETGVKQELEEKIGNKYIFSRISKTPWGILLIGEDITERKLSEDKLRTKNIELEKARKDLDHLSRTDPLTKLPNRRDIIEKIQYEIFRFERSKLSFILILGDIDDFKKINDTYGHNAGDYILTTLSEIMQKNIRKQDIVARWGGEEFLFMLPATPLEGGKNVAENIRQKIESYKFIYNDVYIKVSMTLGVSIFAELETIDECVKKADDALYEGKRTGKNCVIVG